MAPAMVNGLKVEPGSKLSLIQKFLQREFKASYNWMLSKLSSVLLNSASVICEKSYSSSSGISSVEASSVLPSSDVSSSDVSSSEVSSELSSSVLPSSVDASSVDASSVVS